MREETRTLSIGEALDMAVQLAMVGQYQGAETLCRGVIINEPDNFEAIERLGSIMFETRRYHEALYWFWRGRKLDRKNPLALTNYGLTVSQLGHWEEGLIDVERAVYHAERNGRNGRTIAPEAMALIYNNLGNTLERCGRHPEALVALDKGLHFNPKDAFARYNRGIVLMRLNRHREAVTELDRSLELDARDHDARYNRAMGHLLLGNLGQGFEDYEARLLTTENQAPNLGLDPGLKWMGDMLPGKRILVHCEQGLGDTIQFLRFIPLLLQERPAELLLIVHDAIRPIAEQIPGVTVLPKGAPLKDRFDCWVALMSLPLFLGIDEESKIPEPWLPPMLDEERLAKWQGELAKTGHGLKVGVVWAGQFQHKNDAHRSIPLKQFARLFDASANFISLQQMRAGETAEFEKIKAQHPATVSALWLEDLRDTAAVIVNLDMVISADTAVAHLAATLGVPTTILIPQFGTDWRWQLERTDSPWYPSARLYRQPEVGDWDSVIDRIRRELSVAAGSLAA